jgi:hypothetical protein
VKTRAPCALSPADTSDDKQDKMVAFWCSVGAHAALVALWSIFGPFIVAFALVREIRR